MFNLTDCNPSQREAVTFGEGPLLLLAGPGSGKTFTITKRILWLIHEKEVAPEQILVITFTREAALSMQQRFAQTSSFAGSDLIFVFHLRDCPVVLCPTGAGFDKKPNEMFRN